MVSIHQCDLQRTVMLNPAAKRYRVQADAAGAQTANQPGPSGGALAAQTALSAGQSPRGGVVTLTMTLTDTLERQTMFGLEARHVKTVMTKQSDASACDKTPLRSEIDGWYIDLPKTALPGGRELVAFKDVAMAFAGRPIHRCRDRIDRP